MEPTDNTVVGVQISNIHAVLKEIRESIRELKTDAEDSGKWRAGTEEVLDSMIERTDNVIEDVEKLKTSARDHQSFIDQFTGGKLATAQLVTQIATLGGMLVTLYKVFTTR